MSNARLWIALAGLGVLGSSAYFHLPAPTDTEFGLSTAPAAKATKGGLDEQMPAAYAEEITLLREALTALDSRTTRLETRLRQLTGAVPAGDKNPLPAATTAADPLPQSLDPVVLAEQSEAHWDDYLSTLETSLNYSTADKQQASVIEDDIELALTHKDMPAATLTDLECRKTLCRVELVHTDPAALAEFDAELPQRLAEIAPQIAMDRIELDDGSTSTLIYLAPDGYLLPQPEE